ncbi:MAG TPA: type IV pilin protein [Noviherbaspirillum sp.]
MHGRKNELRQRGFTLIELMVALAIVAILAAIAYPSYQESVRRAKRAEARAALLQVMQQQERYYSQRNTYLAYSAASTDADEKRFKWFSAGDAAGSAYEIRAVACTDLSLQECVEVQALPGTSKVDSAYTDPKCGTLTLTSRGEKGAKDAACWR